MNKMSNIFAFILLFHIFGHSVFVSSIEIIGNYSELNPKTCGFSRFSSELDTNCFRWHKPLLPPMKDSKNVEPGEAPWMVFIMNLNDEIIDNVTLQYIGVCSGALIADQWVLTAAHCLKDYPVKMYFGFELHENLSDLYNSAEYTSVEKYAHPEYNSSDFFTHPNDIGLIKLNQSIDTTPIGVFAVENSICLPPKKARIPDIEAEYAMTAGWGDSYEYRRLQMAYLKIDYQDDDLTNLINQSLLVTRKLDNQKFCQGDSGAPVWQYHLGRAVLIGVLSVSYLDNQTSCQHDTYDNTTEVVAGVVWVGAKIDWIQNITKLT